jgi:hypothetical protein
LPEGKKKEGGQLIFEQLLIRVAGKVQIKKKASSIVTALTQKTLRTPAARESRIAFTV